MAIFRSSTPLAFVLGIAALLLFQPLAVSVACVGMLALHIHQCHVVMMTSFLGQRACMIDTSQSIPFLLLLVFICVTAHLWNHSFAMVCLLIQTMKMTMLARHQSLVAKELLRTLDPKYFQKGIYVGIWLHSASCYKPACMSYL